MSPALLWFAKKFWVYGVVAALAMAGTWKACDRIYGAKITSLVRQHDIDLVQLRDDLTSQFNKQKAVTDELNRQNQDLIDNLDSRLAAALSMRPRACVPVNVPASSPPSGNPEDAQRGYVRPHGGIDSDDLLRYARDAEAIRLDQNTCVNFLNQLYKMGQER